MKTPDDRDLLNNLSIAYKLNRQPAEAFAVLLHGLEVHADFQLFHFNIAVNRSRCYIQPPSYCSELQTLQAQLQGFRPALVSFRYCGRFTQFCVPNFRNSGQL